MASTKDNLSGFRRIVAPSRQTFSKPLSVMAFWSAIALPALYLPLLFAGLESLNGLGLFLGLFGLHIVALILGQSHRRD